MVNDAGPRFSQAAAPAASPDARALLDAWRARGADQLDPVRFHFIEALERRAAAHAGEARRLIDARLAQLLDAFADDLARETSNITHGLGDETARSELGRLVDSLARPEPAQPATRVRHEPDPELVEYFRQTWSRVRSEKQLRQSLDQVPRNAGPLNSSSLVHRALSLMREVSPGYLQQFLAYADALSWLEQLNASVGVAAPVREAPRATSAKKGARKGR
ncbi:DUF2894 domain-containing protein [Paraburkholderia sp. CNPSo 3281]|uniref:DUF2894 domain-containing protein n=1 Tax=Paraburkholderia sp. CNPSo 3281 TaxID=2940933 RepID=UPI0020B6A626|nr:DUF2894 domain-containing protein [Paraburkholderia sp. CNPSo 3281]MCP3719197.1 DUF2894 domain-containing protein [Paraburkholderia sp. CNPSo 3281]